MSISSPVEIRKVEDVIDEIVAHDVRSLHIEQMSNDSFYMGVVASDGSLWQFWLGAKNRRSSVEIRHTDTDWPAN